MTNNLGRGNLYPGGDEMDLVTTLARKGLTSSMAQARRLIRMGGVRVNGGIIDTNIELEGDEEITLRKAKECTDIHKAHRTRKP